MPEPVHAPGRLRRPRQQEVRLLDGLPARSKPNRWRLRVREPVNRMLGRMQMSG
jgi:hypothetical protein